MGCGLATGGAILLRPDGGLLLAAIEFYLLMLLLRAWKRQNAGGHARTARALYISHYEAGLILGLVSLAPLVPWAWRNLHTLHRFQPLAPRYANEEDEFVPAGFNRWVKTWIADYASVEEIYWPVPGDTMDADKLPARAFDSEAQRQQTRATVGGIQRPAPHHSGTRCPFCRPGQRAHSAAAPLRYYVWLPLVRIADMWLRPRTETLPSDSRWWEFNDDPKWSALAVTLGVVGLLYIALAAYGLVRSWTCLHWVCYSHS